MFNYNRSNTISPGKPLIPQLQANRCLFSGSETEGNLANQANQEKLVNLCAKLAGKLQEISIVHKQYVTHKNDATNAELQQMKTLYNEAIVKEKKAEICSFQNSSMLKAFIEGNS